MQLRFGGILVAFACVLLSGFAFGAETPKGTEIVWLRENGVTKTVYRITDENKTPFQCLKRALEDARDDDVIEVRDAVFGDNKESLASNQLDISKNVEIVLGKTNTSIGIKDDVSNGYAYPLKFKITNGAQVKVSNSQRICAQFEVEDGALNLVGGQFYAPNVEDSIVLTSVADKESNVVIDGAELLGIYEKYTGTTLPRYSNAAVKWNSKGRLNLQNSSKITAYEYSHIKNMFYNGIVMLQGNAIVDGATISSDAVGISVGDNEKSYKGDGGTCIVNNSSITSDGDGIFAMVNGGADSHVTIALTNTTVSSLNSGVNLCCQGNKQEVVEKSNVELDGVTITTRSKSSSTYAICDNSEGDWWDVQIVRGTFYRMKKYLDYATGPIATTNLWVAKEKEGEKVSCTWNPTIGDDNLTLTVTREVSLTFGVVFHYYIGGNYGDCDEDISVTNTYTIPYGGSQSISGVVPSVTNYNGVFVGWYASKNDAIAHSNQVSSVNGPTELYAGWHDCRVTFKDNKNDDGIDNHECTTGLAYSVVNNQIQISCKPASFGWSSHSGYSFVGWCHDPECEGALITALPIPVTNNVLYAKWVEKKGGVAWVEGYDGTNIFRTVADAIKEAGGISNAVFLIDNVVDETIVVAGCDARLQLNGYCIGDANAADEEVLKVAGKELIIEGEGGTIYGRITIDGGSKVTLAGGTYVCKNGAIVTGAGTDGYVFTANGATFKGEDEFYALDFKEKGGLVAISNSTIDCVASPLKLSVGVAMEGGDLFLDGVTIVSGDFGIAVSNASCLVSGKSSITAPIGVLMEASDVEVLDTSIVSSELTSEEDYPYAFRMVNSPTDNSSLTLSGRNSIVGGNSDESKAHKFVKGGLFYYDAGWEDRILIYSGTYSHQISNDLVVTKWIATNCVAVWETDTRFTVSNPNAVFDIEYDMTNNLPATAIASGVKVTNQNTNTTYRADENYSFKSARCDNVEGYSCEFQGWFFRDPTNSSYQVVAISNGYVVVQQGNSKVVTEITGDLIGGKALVAKWGDWVRTPCTVMFASGAVIKDVDEEDPELISYHEVLIDDEDDMKQNGVSLDDDFPVDGLDFFVADKTITLPSGIHWEGHTLVGWAVYEPDSIEDPDYPPEWTNQFLVGEVQLKDFVDSEGNVLDGCTLHAVWDVGSGQKGISSFDELYNEDDLPPLTGGDTYVGVITDNDGSVIGTISVKCGMPQGDGSVNIVATVKMLNGDSRTFMGKGAYMGDTIEVDLTSGEHTLWLMLNSKMIADGDYDGYAIAGGINKFKGSETDKEEGDARLEHWLGKWTFIFATEDATSAYNTQKTEDGEFVEKDGLEYDCSFGDMHAYGYSYVQIDIGNKGKVKIEGKLANGKDISTTATAIVGDYGVCVPVMCSVYSGWERLFTGGRRGGFGFTAWFSNSETNAYGAIESNDGDVITINGVSEWDSSMSKSTPFTATLVPTNCQRVADIELEDGQKFVFDIDLDTPGWKDHEKLDWIYEDWLPLSPYWGMGYIQYVTVGGVSSHDTNETERVGCNLSVPNKAPKMKLVDSDGWPYVVPNKGGTNYSALKIKYNNDKGLFKGSFRVYSVRTNDETGKSALKTTKISFKGAIADGQGYGVGRNSKYGSHPIMLSNPTNLVDEVAGGDEGRDEDDDEGEEGDEEPIEE